MSFYNIFRHAPYQKEIEDVGLVARMYKHWRFRIFYSIFIGYISFYVTRKSLVCAMPFLINELGYTKVELGILGSVLYGVLGVSKFVSGVVSDKSNPRYFFAAGLILTGIFNILFGMSSSILFFAIFWGLNGWFQGWGSPPCGRLLRHWYAQSERGRWWGIWSTSHNVGGALTPLLVVQAAGMFGWRVSMFIPGIWCILVGLFLINRLRDTPQSLGLPSIEKFSGEILPQEAEAEDEERELSGRELLVEHVLKNGYIWILGFTYFFVYVLRSAMSDWGLLFLYESKQFSLLAAASCIFSFEVGGFFGTIVSGWVSDKFFAGRRGPVNVLFSLLALLSTFLLWVMPANAFIVATGIMFAVGFSIFGPQMLIGVAAVELSHKKAAGTSNGFVGCFAYAGAAVAGGYPGGWVIQEWGWNALFILLLASMAISVFLLTPLWSVTRKPVTPRKEIPKPSSV